MDGFYSNEYYGPDHQRFKRAPERIILLFRRARAMRVMHMIPVGGAVLDVGCGRGEFLDILAKHGYRCLGTERSEASGCDAGKHVKVMVGNIEDLNLPDESFDLVTFWQVLEHLHDPKQAIAEASRILRPGGKMLIQVPNPESIQARTGPYWFHLDPPRHLYLMPLHCLDKVAYQSGLAREKVTTLNFEYSPFGVLQSLWNITGVRRDLLYEMLMAAENKESPLPASTRAALLTSSILAAPFAALLSLAEWAIGKGGIIEAVYVKKKN